MAIERPISHPDPAVSVVIPTIPDYELKTLSALRTQTEDRFEVVIVSDASLDRCEARNKGIKAASADVIAQTDDDCYPPDDWIERIRRFFAENPNKVLLEGPLDKLRLPARRYIGANMAYRRAPALEIGGFDSEFAGWRADTDFGFRMEIAYGIERCHHAPELEVVHDGPTRTTVDRSKERMFRMKYPRRYFTVLYCPAIPFGKQIGSSIAECYAVSPRLGEILLKGGKLVRPFVNSG